MAGTIQIVLVVSALIAFASQTQALKCYECKLPTKECLLNYQQFVKDCDSDLLSQAGQFLGSKKPVCAKIQQGKFPPID